MTDSIVLALSRFANALTNAGITGPIEVTLTPGDFRRVLSAMPGELSGDGVLRINATLAFRIQAKPESRGGRTLVYLQSEITPEMIEASKAMGVEFVSTVVPEPPRLPGSDDEPTKP
jgi:hypothetical protein